MASAGHEVVEGVLLGHPAAVLIPVPAQLGSAAHVRDGEDQAPVQQRQPGHREPGIGRDAVGAVAVQHPGGPGVRSYVVAVHQTDRHGRPVGGSGPQSALAQPAQVDAGHLQLLEQRWRAGVDVDVVDRRRAQQRLVHHLQRAGPWIGGGPEEQGAERPRDAHLAGVGEAVRPPGHQAHSGAAIGAHGYRDEPVEHVDAGDEFVRARPGQRAPFGLRGTGPGQQGHLEIAAVGVVQQQDRVAARLGVGQHAGSARQHRDRRPGSGGVDEEGLRRGLGRRHQHDPPIIHGGGDGQEEVLVGLAQHQFVGVGGGAEPVAPDLVRTPGVVQPGVVHQGAVAGPGQAFADLADLIVQHLPGGQVAHHQVVALVPGAVDREAEQAAVGADLAGAQREEPTGSLGVLVQQQLFPLRRTILDQLRTRRCGLGRDPSVHGIRLAGHGARVVPPTAVVDRDRHVGLDGPAADLFDDRVSQRPQGAGLLRGEGVLGLEVGLQPGILLVGHPRVVVHQPVPVHGPLGWLAGGAGGGR